MTNDQCQPDSALEREIEHILFGRIMKARLEGYTVETARQIMELIAAHRGSGVQTASDIWNADGDAVPRNKSVLVRWPSGEHDICYRTDSEGVCIDTWRYATGPMRGSAAGWPKAWAFIDAALALSSADCEPPLTMSMFLNRE
ncbi:MAG: hypothetical protein V4636_09070, partial [Pseudomonadota bacterium]